MLILAELGLSYVLLEVSGEFCISLVSYTMLELAKVIVLLGRIINHYNTNYILKLEHSFQVGPFVDYIG